MATDWSNTPSDVAAGINKVRQARYGDPTPNMEVFARLLSAYFAIEVLPEDAVMVCILLKMMREKQGGFQTDYRDNLIDICGWANVLEKVKQREPSSPAART